MSQGLTNTKRRIKSISSTRKITKAMELVATVKLKKWKDRMENIVSYLNVMNNIISSCSDKEGPTDILELKEYNEATSNLYVVVTSSLGLCGGYNYNLFKFLNSLIKKNDKVLVVGTKGFVKYSREEVELNDEYVTLLDKLDYQKVQNLVYDLRNEYASGKYNKVYLISTEYVNSLTFVPREYQLLPLSGQKETNDIKQEVLFEPSKEEVLALIIPKYLNTFLYGRLIEASVCEQAARRNAMDSATDNAEELLEKLRIEYNKARQGAITQEITEVVAGASNS